jgi:hypothetical protein
MNIEVVELIKIYNFYLVISSSDKMVVTLFIKFIYLSYSFIKMTTLLIRVGWGRRREAGGQGFERRWPQSARFSLEKSCDL